MRTTKQATFLLRCPHCQSDTVVTSLQSLLKDLSVSSEKHCPTCKRLYLTDDFTSNLPNSSPPDQSPTPTLSSNPNLDELLMELFSKAPDFPLTLSDLSLLSSVIVASPMYQVLALPIQQALLNRLATMWHRALSMRLDDLNSSETSGEQSTQPPTNPSYYNPSQTSGQEQLRQSSRSSQEFPSPGQSPQTS